MANGEDVLEVSDVDALLDRGLRADEEHDLDVAERILDEASDRLGENHPRVLHLAGRIAWANGDVERAAGFFQQAADAKPERADIHIDCARCLHLLGDDDSAAEEQLRLALALPDIDSLEQGDARVLLARIRLDDEDPEEALELLEAIPESLKAHALYLSNLADVLVELDRTDEAIALVERAVAAEPDEADYHYQLALVRHSAGDLEGGTEAMLRVLQLETQARGPSAEPTSQQVQGLRHALEQAMAELPDPLLELVANAPISVQARATEEQVREGIDPRSSVFFVGDPKLEGQQARLEGIVLARDVLLDEIEDEDELSEALLVALAGELADFFDREDLVYAGVGG